MIILIASALIVGVISAQNPLEQDPLVKKWSQECVEETKADISVYVNLKRGIKPAKDLLEKRDLKCFHRCMQQKSGLINEKDEPDIGKIKSALKIDEKTPGFVEAMRCNSSDPDPCQRIHDIAVCFMDKVKFEGSR